MRDTDARENSWRESSGSTIEEKHRAAERRAVLFFLAISGLPVGFVALERQTAFENASIFLLEVELMKYGLFLAMFSAANGAGSEVWLQYAMFGSYPLALFGFCTLIVMLFKMVQISGKSPVVNLSMAAENQVEINETGEFEISLEVPRLTFLADSGLQYELISEQNNQAIELYPTANTHLSRNTITTMIFPVRFFRLSEAGMYKLRVSGFDPQKDYSRFRLLVSRPTTGKMILYLFGILGSALLLTAGIVFTAIAHNAQK